jgi:PIN domain nuclease of toxin-antitoxin system
VSALVLDASALIAVDRDDRAMLARLRVVRSSPGRLLRSVEIRAVDAQLGREAPVLRP